MEISGYSGGSLTLTSPNPISKVIGHDSIWAWHFLRANPEYIDAWNTYSGGSSPLIQEQFSFPWRQYKQSKLDKKAFRWGLHRWLDPLSNGEIGQPLLWSVMPTMDFSLISEYRGRTYTTLNQILRLVKKRNGDITGFVLLDGDLILRIRLLNLVFQMRIDDGGKNVDPEKCIEVRFILDTKNRKSFENLRSFARALYPHQTRKIRIDPKSLLLAIEGKLQGHCHRQIAIALFGISRVEKEWNESKAFRDSIDYRLRLAEDIVNGDYMDFASGKRSFFVQD